MEDMSGQIGVSVVCNTYNQEKYISTAIESFLMQKTSFSYEIIVHDDCSTDTTTSIVRKFETSYPGKIRGIYECENQYSRGVNFNRKIIRNVARGKYIALCEGDDFWIDESKLQLQWDTMEKHPECDMCACWGCAVAEDGKREVAQIRPREGDGILTMEDVILGGGLYLATAGLFFRKALYDNMMAFEKVLSLDYTLQMRGALRGGIFFVDKKMAAYRKYAIGSWTSRMLKDEKKLTEHWEKERAVLRALDADTGGKYHETIQKQINAYQLFSEQLECRRDEIRQRMCDIKGKIYIWGMGRRGRSLENFLDKENIRIEGVCDIQNTDIGQKTDCGNLIVSTDEVLQKGDVILVSTQWAYKDLSNMNFSGELIDFQQYMPWG